MYHHSVDLKTVEFILAEKMLGIKKIAGDLWIFPKTGDFFYYFFFLEIEGK